MGAMIFLSGLFWVLITARALSACCVVAAFFAPPALILYSFGCLLLR
jgi:hypothetical protein